MEGIVEELEQENEKLVQEHVELKQENEKLVQEHEELEQAYERNRREIEELEGRLERIRAELERRTSLRYFSPFPKDFALFSTIPIFLLE